MFTDLAISDQDKLFGITYEDLYQINPHDGSSTLVGSLGDDGFNALGFAPGSSAGNGLYAASGSGFYRLNTETGAASLIKDFGSDFYSSGDLVFDIDTNSFWATSRTGSTDDLYSISLDGTATKVSDLSESQVLGLSLDETGNLLGYTADGQLLSINKETGQIDSQEEIEGLNGSIYGATEDLSDLGVNGTITGGNTGGDLLDSVTDPEFRNVGFREVQTPVGEGGKTWVIIHGWNSSPDAENIASLIDKTAQTADESDRILALDWSEASNNTGGILNTGGNGIAATWIGPTAQFAVETLEKEYGIDAASASQNLNLVGHSLGSLVSSEIGQIYKNGTNRGGEVVTTGNNQGVRTITALDPAAETNLNGGYDVDGRVEGRQAPADFNDSANFSRSFIGRRSIAGNPGFADSADEAYELNFGNFGDSGAEHGRVIQAFTNFLDHPGKIGELVGYDSYQSLLEMIL